MGVPREACAEGEEDRDRWTARSSLTQLAPPGCRHSGLFLHRSIGTRVWITGWAMVGLVPGGLLSRLLLFLHGLCPLLHPKAEEARVHA